MVNRKRGVDIEFINGYYLKRLKYKLIFHWILTFVF